MVSGRLLAAAAVFGSATSVIGAQDAAAPGDATFVNAQPMKRENPTYPGGAAMQSQEGWVMLSFVISEAGEVGELMIEDSSGVPALEKAAMEAVEDWRYTPAMQDGRPVEQAMVETRIVFKLEGQTGASRDFITKYRRALNALNERDFAAAQPLIDDLEFGGRKNLYEDAWFWWLKYAHLEASGSTDTSAMQQSLQRALGYVEEYLPPDQFVEAAQRLYVSYAKSVDFSSALATFERLRDAKTAQQSDHYERVIEALTPSYARIQEIVASGEVISQEGRVGEFDYWVHDLLRRSFSVTNVSGQLDVLDVRCKLATKRYSPVPTDSTWTVPESWGECGVYIKGEPGTTFVFSEHPASSLPKVSQPAVTP
jgi:TonB family protein